MKNIYLAGYMCGYLHKGMNPRFLGYTAGYLTKVAETPGSSEGGGSSSDGSVTEVKGDDNQPDDEKKKKDPNNPWISQGIQSNTVPAGSDGSSSTPPDHGQ